MTTNELITITKLSRQTLSQARNGYMSVKGYKVDPRLIKGTDWEWNDGVIIYNDSALIKLKNSKKGRKRKAAI